MDNLMKKKLDPVIRDYILFMIDKKEIKGLTYMNRPASDYYRLLKQNAILYNCSVMDVLKQNAYFVMEGEFISLIKH